MLDPQPPSLATAPTTFIPYMINCEPFYGTLELVSGPDSITVNGVLERASLWLGVSPSDLRLRWITDKSATFPPQWQHCSSFTTPKTVTLLERRREVTAWYADKGHYLATEPITTDGSLRQRLCGSTSAGEVQLYVIGLATTPWDMSYNLTGVEEGESSVQEILTRSQNLTNRCPIRSEHQKYRLYGGPLSNKHCYEDKSILTRMAALYDPAFAYTENALRNLQDAKPDSDIYEEGNASSVGVHIDGGQDETLDARLLLVQLRDALNNLNTGHSESREIDRAHAEALGKLFQQLFDDPTLEVDVQSQIYTDRLARLEIQGGCPTPCGEPACYVIGKNKLKAPCEAGPEGAVGVQQGGMLAYKNAFLEKTRASIFQTTCCPSLVVETAGTTIQLYAAYFADWICHTHLCDFVLDPDAGSDDVSEHRNIMNERKVHIVRRTARMLREAYARVHTGAPVRKGTSTRYPDLLPRPAILMPTPLPLHLHLLDRVNVGAYSDLFTGMLKLPRPSSSTACSNNDRPEFEFASARELPVHVKFVKEYGVAAHRLLAEHRSKADGAPWPLAPQLYWAGEIVAGLLMIVMETLPPDARMLCRYSNPNADSQAGDDDSYYDDDYKGYDDYDKVQREPPVAWEELGDVRAAVQLLHAHGFVHGDIRSGNVMLQRPPPHASDSTGPSTGATASTGGGGGAETPRAFLIDFDWAGKEGEARYSVGLNPDIEWPRPASELGGQLITKEDDAFMLERLLPQVPQESGREPERDDNVSVDTRKRKRDDTSSAKVPLPEATLSFPVALGKRYSSPQAA